jgi:hypothetical protein
VRPVARPRALGPSARRMARPPRGCLTSCARRGRSRNGPFRAFGFDGAQWHVREVPPGQ